MRYSLRCGKGHVFDSWFRNSAAYELAKKHGALECPICGNSSVAKDIMAPSVIGTSKRKHRPSTDIVNNASLTCDTAVSAASSEKLLEQFAKYRELVSSIKRDLSKNAEWVGDRFATEARARHENEPAKPQSDVSSDNTSRVGDKDDPSNPRPIWGNATVAEAKELWEDGINVIPLPPDPSEKN